MKDMEDVEDVWNESFDRFDLTLGVLPVSTKPCGQIDAIAAECVTKEQVVEVGMYFRSRDCLHGLDLIGDVLFLFARFFFAIW